ncbi:MAG: hypothetical protein ISQ06_09845 [Planctomycetaceae bacterium]|nr:hypothetical protein [Planctomycetaceae bacterium]
MSARHLQYRPQSLATITATSTAHTDSPLYLTGLTQVGGTFLQSPDNSGINDEDLIFDNVVGSSADCRVRPI